MYRTGARLFLICFRLCLSYCHLFWMLRLECSRRDSELWYSYHPTRRQPQHPWAPCRWRLNYDSIWLGWRSRCSHHHWARLLWCNGRWQSGSTLWQMLHCPYSSNDLQCFLHGRETLCWYRIIFSWRIWSGCCGRQAWVRVNSLFAYLTILQATSII